MRRSTAARQSMSLHRTFANVRACWLDCRFSRASDIHSRMMARLIFEFAISISFARARRREDP
jgi:hypothetical protein